MLSLAKGPFNFLRSDAKSSWIFTLPMSVFILETRDQLRDPGLCYKCTSARFFGRIPQLSGEPEQCLQTFNKAMKRNKKRGMSEALTQRESVTDFVLLDWINDIPLASNILSQCLAPHCYAIPWPGVALVSGVNRGMPSSESRLAPGHGILTMFGG